MRAKQGKPSMTKGNSPAEKDGPAIMEITHETGRAEQIRVHSAIGFGLPLLGDAASGRNGSASKAIVHTESVHAPHQGEPDNSAPTLTAAFAAPGLP